MKVVKNKMAPPFREVEFDILYGQGISRSGDVLDLATELGIVEKSGAWFSFQGERIGQGRENAKAYLEQHPAADGQAREPDPREAQHQARWRGRDRRRRGRQRQQRHGHRQGPAPKAEAKPEVAPDGKPVVRIPAAGAAPKNGTASAEDPKRAATKPAN